MIDVNVDSVINEWLSSFVNSSYEVDVVNTHYNKENREINMDVKITCKTEIQVINVEGKFDID